MPPEPAVLHAICYAEPALPAWREATMSGGFAVRVGLPRARRGWDHQACGSIGERVDRGCPVIGALRSAIMDGQARHLGPGRRGAAGRIFREPSWADGRTPAIRWGEESRPCEISEGKDRSRVAACLLPRKRRGSHITMAPVDNPHAMPTADVVLSAAEGFCLADCVPAYAKLLQARDPYAHSGSSAGSISRPLSHGSSDLGPLWDLPAGGSDSLLLYATIATKRPCGSTERRVRGARAASNGPSSVAERSLADSPRERS